MITDQNYLNWQKKIEENSIFRRVWVFFGIYSILLIYALGFYLFIIGNYRQLFLTAVAFVLARLIISPAIFLFYKKERPYQKVNFVPPNSPWFFSGLTTKLNSFPSDHAGSFASIVISLFWLYPIFGLILVPIVVLNGIARVVLGYHYISDILAGWVVGAFAAWAVFAFLVPVLFT